MPNPEIKRRLEEFVAARELLVTGFLGGGTDGEVWTSDRKTAMKVFQYQKNYLMELQAYQRLRSRGVRMIREFVVPRLVEADDRLLVIEMDIVSPSCVIDFGKAYLDAEPDHSAETWAEHHAAQKELWATNTTKFRQSCGNSSSTASTTAMQSPRTSSSQSIASP